jgi:Protein of unknown function (DUF1559)
MNRIVSAVIAGCLVVLLLALGVPALLRWRTQAERTRCQDHLRRVALALTDYAKHEEAFPPGALPAKDLPPGKRLSWVVPILPRLGHDALAKQIDIATAWDAAGNRTAATTVLKPLLCPALLEITSPDGYGLLHYPGIAGVGADAANLGRDDPRAGIFRYTDPTPLAAVKDGLSNVLLLMETAHQAGPWIAGGPASVRPVDPAERPYIGAGRPFGGNHLGGANAAFSDASYRFLSERINPTVLEMLAAMADGGPDPGIEK